MGSRQGLAATAFSIRFRTTDGKQLHGTAESTSFFNPADNGTFRPHDMLLIADSGEIVEPQGISRTPAGAA